MQNCIFLNSEKVACLMSPGSRCALSQAGLATDREVQPELDRSVSGGSDYLQ